MKKIIFLAGVVIFLSAPLAFATQNCTPNPENLPKNINIAKVRETWLDWYNVARAQKKLKPYIYNLQLKRLYRRTDKSNSSQLRFLHGREKQKKSRSL